MLKPQEFVNKYINKATDVDKYYGAQCWDMFARFNLEAGYPVFNCTSSGYVKDIWNLRKSSGILKYFEEVPVNKMQDGDWVIWGECAACPYSHIAMFRKDNGNNTGTFFGQNQGGRQAASQINIPYAGILGALRPKCYVKKCNFKSSGAVKALYDGICVRTEPTVKKADTGLRYDTGGVLYYYDIVLNDGWYWAKYKRYNGGTGYCALCSEDGKTVFWKQV